MARFTVRLDEELAEWVEEEADERDRSKAWVVEQAVAAAKGDGSVYSVGTGAVRTGANEAGEHRVDELEQRLADLEARLGERDDRNDRDVETEASGEEADSAPRDLQGSDQGEEAVVTFTDTDDGLFANYRAFLAERPPKKVRAKDAIMVALRTLRDEEKMDTTELRDVLADEVGEHYKSDKSMWESYRRYLNELPGFDRDYGTWTYPGDDTVRNALADSTDEDDIYDPVAEWD